jgi:hypothetical protein
MCYNLGLWYRMQINSPTLPFKATVNYDNLEAYTTKITYIPHLVFSCSLFYQFHRNYDREKLTSAGTPAVLTKILSGSPQSLQVNCRDSTWITPR